MTYPTIRPSLNFDFQNSKLLDPKIEFSRSSTATYVEGGVVKTASSNVARFEKQGLLLEEERTNAIYPSIIPTTSTDKVLVNDASLTASSGTAPDGSNDATLFDVDSGSGSNRFYVFTGGVVQDEVYSIYIKSNSSDAAFGMRFSGSYVSSSGNNDVLYTFSTGTLSGDFYDAYPDQVSVESLANGWFRLVLTNKVNTTSSSGAYLQTRDSVGEILVWGFQREVGTDVTSHIPTTSSTVTRSADQAKISGDEFSSWFNENEGTLIINATNVEEGNYVSALTSGTTGTPDTLALYRKDNDEWRAYNTAQVTFTSTDSDANSALAYSVSDTTRTASAAWKGSLVSNVPTDTSSIAFTSLQIGTGPKTVGHSNGHVSKLSYYDRQLSDAELEKITS